MRLLICACRFATPQGVGRIGDEALTARERRLTHSAFSIYCDTQVEGRSCILGNKLILASDVLFAKLVVDVVSGFLRRGDD